MAEPLVPDSAAQTRWSAVAFIAATYVYFLIFAEFAFLEQVRAVDDSTQGMRGIMLLLGLSGILGASGAAVAFHPARAAGMLRWLLRACAAAGAGTLVASSRGTLAGVAVITGAALGGLTVTVASMLRPCFGCARLGWTIGWGTGAAYAFCNLPVVFQASAATQTLVAVGVVLLASFLPVVREPTASGQLGPLRIAGGNVFRWVVVLLALVWLDSAAFYVVQHTTTLRGATWGDAGLLSGNAIVHLGAAVMAGSWIDRGGRVGAVAAGVVGLVLAGLTLNGIFPAWVAPGWFYTAGVSFYSVVLVEVPARAARPAVAALIFSVAGWIGSALGIGMAQDLHVIPNWFIGTAAVAVVLALGVRPRWIRGAAALTIAAGSLRAQEALLGREVYIAEGCLHCHSQYIRPRVTAEVLNWGPARNLEDVLNAAPPLFGTRRQGPDLSQVGNRRSPEWNRLHLLNPPAVSPGSRMPSYAHLFRLGDERGPALVAYLASLGAESIAWRNRQAAEWTPGSQGGISPAAASHLFGRLCSQCHGPSGGGDGPLADALSIRPPNWAQGTWRRIQPAVDVDIQLSRTIKFGITGSPMAGHEYLRDEEILGLARHVRTLHAARDGASVSAPP